MQMSNFKFSQKTVRYEISWLCVVVIQCACSKWIHCQFRCVGGCRCKLQILSNRTRSFLETGFWPLYPSFVWFVPLSRTKRVFLISTRTRPRSWQPGPSWLPGSTPMSFQESFRVERVRYEMSWLHVAVCCSVLQCVQARKFCQKTVRYEMFWRCFAVCCSVLQSVAVCVGAKMLSKHDVSLQLSWMCVAAIQGVCFAVCFSVFQCVTVCCSVLQCVAQYCSVHMCVRHDSWQLATKCLGCVLWCVAVFCSSSALQHVAVCCSVLPAVCCSAKCFMSYGVATMSRMLKNIGLFCKGDLQKRPIFCKETCIFKHPTHRSHPIREIAIMVYILYIFAVHICWVYRFVVFTSVAVCCSVLQCVVVRCSVLLAACCSMKFCMFCTKWIHLSPATCVYICVGLYIWGDYD